MSDDKKKLAQLAKTFDELQQDQTPAWKEGADGDKVGSDSDEDVHKLRSGTTYSRPSTPPPLPPTKLPQPQPSTSLKQHNMNNQTTNPNTMGGGTHLPLTSQLYSSPIKVLPTAATVREYTSTDPDYSAREFINLCEDVMNNSSIVEPADQISFVRSNIRQGSVAAKMMQASAFTKPIKNKNYAAFRSNFLQIFGENVKHSLVKGVHLAVERLLAGAGAQDMFEAQVDANRVSEDLIKYLKDNQWTTGNTMTLQNVGQFLEFFSYMMLLKGKTRKGSLALKYAPGNELYEFAVNLKVKMEEKQGEANFVASTVTASSVTSGVAALNLEQSYDSDTGTNKPVVVCSYCNAPGHTEKRCFALKREKRKSQTKARGGSSSTSTPSQQHNPREKRQPQNGSNKRPTQRNFKDVVQQQATGRSRGAEGGNSYCSLHDTNSHSTDECYTVARIRKEMIEQRNRKAGGMSSGEATRPRKHDPP